MWGRGLFLRYQLWPIGKWIIMSCDSASTPVAETFCQIYHLHRLISEVAFCCWTIKTMIILTCIFFFLVWPVVPSMHCEELCQPGHTVRYIGQVRLVCFGLWLPTSCENYIASILCSTWYINLHILWSHLKLKWR